MVAVNKDYYLRVPKPGQSPYVTHHWPDIDPTMVLFDAHADYQPNHVPNCFRVLALIVELKTSAVVANRLVVVAPSWYQESGGGEYYQLTNDGSIPASTTGGLVLLPVGQGIVSASFFPNIVQVNAYVSFGRLTGDLILTGQDRLIIQISNAQAGDLYSVTLQTEYLNYRLGITEPD